MTSISSISWFIAEFFRSAELVDEWKLFKYRRLFSDAVNKLQKITRDQKPGGHTVVASIGCGRGIELAVLAELFYTKQNMFLVGVDIIDPKNVIIPHCAAYVQASALNLPFRSTTVDILIIKDVLHHILPSLSAQGAFAQALAASRHVIVIEASVGNYLMDLASFPGHIHYTWKELYTLLSEVTTLTSFEPVWSLPFYIPLVAWTITTPLVVITNLTALICWRFLKLRSLVPIIDRTVRYIFPNDTFAVALVSS